VRKRAFRLIATALVILLSTACLAGCKGGDLIYGVEINPSVISPNADGTDDIAEIKYSLARQSTISIYLLDAEGNRYDFRVDQRRSRGERTAYFSGVIADRLLPDGTYTVVFEAKDNDGYIETQEHEITLVDGDKTPLEIQGLSVWPNAFTPNRDGITDRVKISYVLSKEAKRVTVYILDADGVKYPITEDQIREMGAAGAHEHDYDAGIDRGATPPPDGGYTIVVEAEDAVGNKARETASLTIEGGGVPRAEIVNGAAEFSPTVVPLHSTLTFTCTVKNIGTVPIRTKGPESGTTYSTSDNYNTLKEYEEPGVWRVGLDFEGNSAGRVYPYRWQLGTDAELTVIETDIGPETYLLPDQTVTIVGHLTIDEPPAKTEPYYWIGLIHEQVANVQDRVEPTQISIGF